MRSARRSSASSRCSRSCICRRRSTARSRARHKRSRIRCRRCRCWSPQRSSSSTSCSASYESYIHPITILSALPSAGVGALLALMILHYDLSVIAMIGVILLIGIVKKNAIMMIDFALSAERVEGKSPLEAIHEACLLRFRPIMMTTFAALFGGLPIAIGQGAGSELRRPLGIAMVGGLLVSQWLTLYTTPVIYLYLDRLSRWLGASRRPSRLAAALGDAPRPVLVEDSRGAAE